jgi:hypothetical protein
LLLLTPLHGSERIDPGDFRKRASIGKSRFVRMGTIRGAALERSINGRYTVQDPSHWKGTLRGLDENEKPIRGDIVLEKKGPNLFIWRQTNRFVDGSPEPDYELRFTRGRRP